jgi:hypothetical protein
LSTPENSPCISSRLMSTVWPPEARIIWARCRARMES